MRGHARAGLNHDLGAEAKVSLHYIGNDRQTSLPGHRFRWHSDQQSHWLSSQTGLVKVYACAGQLRRRT
ncbi:hypothetical protein AzCIB_3331 [Azoarcus sp. CIB]|nr:hypothetical protein AzCIB_3331 [Azoarcus sp. CIB]